MPQPLARVVCRLVGHDPRWTLAVMFGFDHPICNRCRQGCPRS